MGSSTGARSSGWSPDPWRETRIEAGILAAVGSADRIAASVPEQIGTYPRRPWHAGACSPDRSSKNHPTHGTRAHHNSSGVVGVTCLIGDECTALDRTRVLDPDGASAPGQRLFA